MPAVDPGEYSGLSLEAFLDQVAGPTPAPGGGPVAAVTVALAAALCSMAARKSPRFPGDAAALAELADERRRLALSLASQDAVAYGKVIDAQRVTLLEGREPAVGRSLCEEALSAAADIPLALAEVAAEISGIASELVAGGNLNLVGDSLTAALLASAGAEAAAALVAIDLAGWSASLSGDGRAGRASALAGEAATAAAGARAIARARLGET